MERFNPCTTDACTKQCDSMGVHCEEICIDEIERLRGLLGEPLRVIAVEAIREATGCPDLIGRDGEALTEKLLMKAAALLVPNASGKGPEAAG